MPAADLDAIRGERCRRSLAHFVRHAWPVLNPGRPLAWAWYLDAICLHLEAVTRGTVRRLAITQPPNTLKSTIAAVCWPSWEWTFDPKVRWLYAANEAKLANRDALAMRDLVQSDWYQRTFRPAWRVRDDQESVSWFSNTAGGHRVSYSVNAKITGKKGDRLVLDDPNDAKKVHSPADREAVRAWHDEGFSGRMADEKTTPEVIVGQRLRPDDLIGLQLRKGGWVELRLPEEFDPARRTVTPLWADPRTAAGELLRPDRFGPAEIAARKLDLLDHGYEAQHNQNPVTSGATWFDRAKVAVVPHPPVGTVAVRYWDTAATTGAAACETAGVLVGRAPDGRTVIVDCVAGKWSPLDRDAAIVATAHADRRRPGVTVASTWLEQEPGGSGVSDAESVIRKLAGFAAFAWKETGDKDVRAKPLAGQWQSGNVLVCDGPWLAAFLDEMQTIPGGRKRDRADAAAGAYNRLTAGGVGADLPATAPDGDSILDYAPAVPGDGPAADW